MSRLEFRANEALSLGVEIEIQLIHPETRDLNPVGLEVLSEIAKQERGARTKAEIFQSMLEIDTPICASAGEVGRSLRMSLAETRLVARACGAEIMMAGTHPFAHYSERLVTPTGRYQSLVDRNQWIARRLQIFGLHIHVGMRSGDRAIAFCNAFSHYLPVVLALSASSPFWQGDDTGLASSRITIFEAIPTGGHPILVANWGQFEELADKLLISRSIGSLKDLWWDIRPNLEFGTIEIRIADCPPTLREVEALVALVHSLARLIDKEIEGGREFSPPPEWVLRENKWRASRHGISCDLVRSTEGESAPFAEIWGTLLETLAPTIGELGYLQQFDFLEQIRKRGPSYVRQRCHSEAGLVGVVDHLVREGIADCPEWS
ncbi:MAG: YbdK family carboxylate-amine ligase [Bdellovibrionales bacterium]|nr:YbdK family carboxylate-amine ligase [Bdellovibrionales bacterium]